MSSYDRWSAIHSLVGGQIAGTSDGYDMKYTDGQTPPTEEEINTEMERLQAEYDAQEYTIYRQAEYPPIGDQLDALYHAGVFPANMAARIKETKDKYPK
jgi:hypothetical protein